MAGCFSDDDQCAAPSAGLRLSAKNASTNEDIPPSSFVVFVNNAPNKATCSSGGGPFVCTVYVSGGGHVTFRLDVSGFRSASGEADIPPVNGCNGGGLVTREVLLVPIGVDGGI